MQEKRRFFRHRWRLIFYITTAVSERVRHELKQVLDLERLTSRVVMGRHLPKDITGIAQALRGFFLLFDERYRDLLVTTQQEHEKAFALATHIDRALNPTHQGPLRRGGDS